jgi:hypothetical protein
MSMQTFQVLRNWREDRRGSISVLGGTIMIVVIGLGGLALQEALLFKADMQLQTGAEMAALAAAEKLPTSASAAISTANTYTGLNLVAGQTPTASTNYPKTTCLTSAGGTCTGSSPTPNAVIVQNQVTMPLLFGGLFGMSSKTLYATATASVAGGPSQSTNADVVLIVDTTASMNNADSSCSITNSTSLQCALAGARKMLTNFNPATTNVALMTFPPVSNPSVDYCGTSGTVSTVSYKTAATVSPAYADYLVVPFSSDYKTSSAATTLNSASNLAKAVGAVSTCAGLQAKGGYGTYYADVIADAQSYLTAKGRSGAKQVIVFLSDGDANASSSNMPSGKASNQCHEAITAATAATTAGMTVYTAAYGAPTALQTGSCSTDSAAPAVSACTTLQKMASTSATFFPINQAGATTGCTSSVYANSDAATALANIGTSIVQASSYAMPRLWVNGTN